MVIQHTMCQSCRSHTFHGLAHTGKALVHADTAAFIDAIGSEQVGDVVPHTAIDVVAVGCLKITHQAFVVHYRDAFLEFCQRGSTLWRCASRSRYRNAALV